jgi:hypothetical protein
MLSGRPSGEVFQQPVRGILKNKGPDFRMRDIELLVRFYAFNYYLSDYKGDLKWMLDHTCQKLNMRWSAEEGEIRQIGNEFEAAYNTAKEVFGEKHVFRKWIQGGYESRFNRAIFDVTMHYFAVPEIRAAAVASPKAVEVPAGPQLGRDLKGLVRQYGCDGRNHG